MNAPIIEVKGISKKYRIGHREDYLSLRDSLVNIIKNPLNLLKSSSDTGASNDEFWALKDVSFNVEQGEVIGIIGKNGAGKTTMLKILSRITYPTKGEIRVKGRVASLLEVGTGFHPELTGRENIYFNGSILGMKKREIDKKFDEIVAFSEIEKFIDTPAKRYSSGMYLRLAFAVAAHLEPEILVIDEVLAVGDASFQKKCFGKMGDVAKKGRTVLFVSHNLSIIADLCSRCLCLDKGRVLKTGIPTDVILAYSTSARKYLNGIIAPDMHVNNTGKFYFKKIAMLNENKEPCTHLFFKSPLHIYIEFEVCQYIEAVRLIATIEKLDGALVCACHHTDDVEQHPLDLEQGHYVAEISIPLSLMPGGYTVQLEIKPVPGFWGGKGQSYGWVPRAMDFFIEESSRDGQAALLSRGVVCPDAKWSIYPIL